MDTTHLLVHTVAVLARRQLALETLLQKHGVSKEQIDAAAAQAPIPPIIPTIIPWAYQRTLEDILKALS